MCSIVIQHEKAIKTHVSDNRFFLVFTVKYSKAKNPIFQWFSESDGFSRKLRGRPSFPVDLGPLIHEFCCYLRYSNRSTDMSTLIRTLIILWEYGLGSPCLYSLLSKLGFPPNIWILIWIWWVLETILFNQKVLYYGKIVTRIPKFKF